MLNWPTAIVLSTLIFCIFMIVIYIIGKRMDQNEKKTTWTDDKEELKRQLIEAMKERKQSDD